MKNYFGCNSCHHCFMKGWHRESDNSILRSPKTKEQRNKMKWWVGDETMYPLEQEIKDGSMECWCDECRAFANSVIGEN